MDSDFWGTGGLAQGYGLGAILTPVLLGCFGLWRAYTHWRRARFHTWGGLLLHLEVDGRLAAHLGMLTARARAGRPVYVWPMTQIHRDDFPIAQTRDLSFSHIVVRQPQPQSRLMLISVVARGRRPWGKDFYWVRDAPLGDVPGFPRSLLLPDGLVLKCYFGR